MTETVELVEYRYEWRKGGPKPRVSAQVFGEVVGRLREKRTSKFYAMVVEEARPLDSEIHGAFEWDVNKNSEAHLKTQARNLIGSLNATVVGISEPPPVATKAYYAIGKTEDGVEESRDYEFIGDIQQDRTLRVELMRTVHRELQTYLTKYSLVLGTVGKTVERLQAAMDEITVEIDRLLNEATRGRPRQRFSEDDDRDSDRP